MTTYITRKCDLCKRTTEIEVDPTRPTYNNCTITHKCLGKLKTIATKSVRSALLTAPVSGLTDWRPRNTEISQQTDSIKSILMPITNGKDILTIAVADITTEDLLTATFKVEQKTASPFKQYTFANFKIPTSIVVGSDSTPEKQILRFNNTGLTPDSLQVTLNGVELERAVRAFGHAVVVNGVIVSTVIDQEGSHYDVPPIVQFGGNGSGATGVAVIEDGAVTGINILTGGNGFSGHVPITFINGVTEKYVYYTNYNELQFAPSIPIGSKLEVIVTSFVPVSTVILLFNRHTVNTVGNAWGNVKTVSSDKIYSLFSCSNFYGLQDEVHLTPLILSDTTRNLIDWKFILSADPHENVDRIYSTALKPENANLFRSRNNQNGKDVIIESKYLSSIYPPFSIIDILGSDTFKDKVSADSKIINNDFIVGLAS